MATSRRATLIPIAVAVAGAALVLATFYPGYMSADSLDQYRQARTGLYTWWHPPIMAWLWSKVSALWPGPFGMVLMQNVLFWSGAALLSIGTVRGATAALFVALMGLWPPVFAELGTVWKDVQLGASLLLATALLVHARGSWTRLLGAAVLIFYATAVRSNGVSATLPFMLWWGIEASAAVGWSRFSAAAAMALALCVLVLAGGSFIGTRLAHDRGRWPLQMPFVHDLAGLSGFAKRDLLPAWVHTQAHGLSYSDLVRAYRPETSDPIYFAPGNLALTRDPSQISELRLRWLDAISQNPQRYLSQRALLMKTLLGIGTTHVWYPFHTQIDPNDLGLSASRTVINRRASEILERLRDSMFFRAWVYLAGATILLIVAAAARVTTRASWVLAASAASYVTPYFFVSPAPDFRYVWWPVVACLALPLTFRRGCRDSATGDGLSLPRGIS
jgi:hypothetical protein